MSRVVRREVEPGVESTVLHPSPQRCALLVDESVAYWAHIDPRSSMPDRIREARRDRWFGAKVHPNHLGNRLKELAARYDAFPHALRMLQSVTVPVELRPLVCHLHMALADVRYRRFTGEYLAERRERELGPVGIGLVVDWLRAHEPALKSPTGYEVLATRLLGVAHEAGLVDDAGAPRELAPAEVPARTVAYLMYLLDEIRFAGTLLENAYLRGLGIVGKKKLAAAIEAAPGVKLAARGRRAGLGRDGGVELEERDLLAWGERYWA